MGRLGAARYKDRKWIASPGCTGRYADVHEACALEKLAQLVNSEAEMAIAKPGPDPALVVRFQIHQEHASRGPQHANSFGDGAFRIARMVQRL